MRPDPLDPVEALRRIAEGVEHWDAERDADSISVLWRIGDLARAALAALPASEPTLTGEETVNWYGLLRSAAAILPEVEAPERLLVAARNVAADIDAALAPYPTSFDLPAAAPVPEGVPGDRQRRPGGVPSRWRTVVGAAASPRQAKEATMGEHDYLTVWFLDPDHLALWLEDGEIAGTITMDEGLTATGMLRVWRNDDGVPMLDVNGVLDGDMFSRTALANVQRIEIL